MSGPAVQAGRSGSLVALRASGPPLDRAVRDPSPRNSPAGTRIREGRDTRLREQGSTVRRQRPARRAGPDARSGGHPSILAGEGEAREPAVAAYGGPGGRARHQRDGSSRVARTGLRSRWSRRTAESGLARGHARPGARWWSSGSWRAGGGERGRDQVAQRSRKREEPAGREVTPGESVNGPGSARFLRPLPSCSPSRARLSPCGRSGGSAPPWPPGNHVPVAAGRERKGAIRK